MDLDKFSVLNQSRVFGHIPGIPIGARFRTRRDLWAANVHGVTRKGIHGSKYRGAFSIVLSGEYEDDKDKGDTITYAGSGGRMPDGKQGQDQSMDAPDNVALRLSKERDRPVRVIRRIDFTSRSREYRYDGLYRVDSYYKKEGLSGYQVCLFELSRIVEQGDAEPSQSGEKAAGSEDGSLPPAENSKDKDDIIMRADGELEAE